MKVTFGDAPRGIVGFKIALNDAELLSLLRSSEPLIYEASEPMPICKRFYNLEIIGEDSDEP